MKLGEELRKTVKEKEKYLQDRREKEEQRKYEEARLIAVPLFEELKKTLPDTLKEEANKGRFSYCVLRGMREFTLIESALCQMLITWAHTNGISYNHVKYQRYDGGEDPECLWFDWA